MTTVPKVVFLFDVDNTLLDNDRMEQDLRQHLNQAFSPRARDRYFEIFEELRRELGYANYLRALERHCLEQLHDPRILKLNYNPAAFRKLIKEKAHESNPTAS